MIETQKIIKYCAIAFAIFLTISIIGGIASGLTICGNVISGGNNISDKYTDFATTGDVYELDINVKGVNIIFKEGDNLAAQTNNKYVTIEQNNNKLNVTQKKHNIFSGSVGDLIIYVPADTIFEKVKINAGAGTVNINQLTTEELFFDLGAGKVKLEKITATEKSDINGGTGEITITDAKLNDLDLELGVGKVTITSVITGNSSIDSGIGEVNLNLIGSLDDYKITLDKGIGSAKLDNNNMSDDSTYGTGNNIIDIEGGIGAINIKLI